MASHSNKSSISTLSSIDPGMTSDESSGSPTNSTASYGLTSAASPAFNQAVLDIINDRALSDSTLRGQAHKHLEVLTRENFAKYNVPKWVERATFPDGIDKLKFNMRLMFDAMYRTAEELHLDSGARYVSAAICACATRATSQPKEHQPERLAAELSALGGTWVAYMLWPFVSTGTRSRELSELNSAQSATPTIDHTLSHMLEGTRINREASFREEVCKRDNYTCIITGWIDRTAPQHMRAGGVKQGRLEAGHIFKRSVSVFDKDTNADKLYSLATTYDILKHYCQLDDLAETMSNMDGAQNGILFECNVHQAFDHFEFSLLAEEEPNMYTIKQWIREDQIGAPTPMPIRVTFKDHSQNFINAASQRLSPRGHPGSESGIPLPDPRLLQLHAALAGVLHLCGAADLLQIFNNPPGSDGPAISSDHGEDFEHEVIQYDGIKISSIIELEEAVRQIHTRD